MTAPQFKGCKDCGKEYCSWIFSDLDVQEFSHFTSLVKQIEYDEGETIFRDGVLPFGLHILCEGKVKVTGKSAGGKRQILKLLGPGEVLGEEALFSNGPYTTYAKTLEPSVLAFVARDKFLSFIEEHPSVTLKLIEKLSRELKAFQSKLVETAYEGSEERLARLLLVIGEKFGEADLSGLYIGVELSRAELAEMAGIAPETAIRTLSKLKDGGLISLKGHRIVIQDGEGLRSLAKPFPVTVKENLL